MAEYRILIVFVVVLFVLDRYWNEKPCNGRAFVAGALFSTLAVTLE